MCGCQPICNIIPENWTRLLFIILDYNRLSINGKILFVSFPHIAPITIYFSIHLFVSSIIFPTFYLLYFFPTSHQMIEIEYLLWIIEVQNIVTKITTVKTNRPVIYVTDITWNPMFPNCASPVSILKLLSFIYIPLKNLDISFITME